MSTSKTYRSGLSIAINTKSLKQMSKAFRDAPPEIRHGFRKELRAAAQIVADEAKRNASWSTKIPGSIKVRGSGSALSIIAGGPNAAGAAALEGGGRVKTFKHPVFERQGDDVVGKNGRVYKGGQLRYTWRKNRRAIRKDPSLAAPWVEQQTKPYLAPALDAHRDEIASMLGKIVGKTIDALLDGKEI